MRYYTPKIGEGTYKRYVALRQCLTRLSVMFHQESWVKLIKGNRLKIMRVNGLDYAATRGHLCGFSEVAGTADMSMTKLLTLELNVWSLNDLENDIVTVSLFLFYCLIVSTWVQSKLPYRPERYLEMTRDQTRPILSLNRDSQPPPSKKKMFVLKS